MELLINQRIQLEQIIGKGLSNDGSVPVTYRGINALINSNATKSANDQSMPSEMRSSTELDKNFADFTIRFDGSNVFNFGGLRMLKARHSSEDIISLSPIVRFARKKRLIATPVNDTNEIVERWATEGYDISIDGVLVDVKNQQYPKAQIYNLIKLFDMNKTGVVDGELFNDMDIQDIYITSFAVEPMVGYPDTVVYNIQARSIKPLKFTLLP